MHYVSVSFSYVIQSLSAGLKYTLQYVYASLNYAIQNPTLTSVILVTILTWMIYRLGKRISRRCTCCGSIRYHRWHTRELKEITRDGMGIAICETHQVCLNHRCLLFLKDIEDIRPKAYTKELPLEKMTC
jgi:hypothetical protein